MENENNFKETVSSLFKGMDGFVSAKTVVGDAIHVGDTIILPLVDVSFGVGAGAFAGDKKNNGSGALSRRTNGEEYPKYTPDFVKLAESYGAKGIRVFNKNEVAAAFEEAKKNTKVPTLIEFIIDPEEMVYPMVKPGGTLEDLIMDC